MTTLERFKQEELNEHSLKTILNTIDEAKINGKEKEQITFNRYSIEIFFKNNQVTIYDDVFSEEEPLKLSLETFINSIC